MKNNNKHSYHGSNMLYLNDKINALGDALTRTNRTVSKLAFRTGLAFVCVWAWGAIADKQIRELDRRLDKLEDEAKETKKQED